MSEKNKQQPSSSESWKERGTKEKPYRARRVSHEANTSIEYGEKTWTTAQTVRDLMQNHLDAETERYYKQIAKIIFVENGLKQYFDSSSDETERKRAEDFLYAAFMFANHVEDMTGEARLQSGAYLQKLAQGFLVNGALQKENVFSPSLFLEAVRPVEEHRPLVSYEITDTQAHGAIEWVAYETLRDEQLYQSKNKDDFRYKITGMKIVDRGSGFDSQLSALYLSSKIGKKHLRGKFGEGAKMSELHLLRNGASMKMRSRYTIKSGDEAEKSRVWQTRPRVQDGRLVSRGVEVEQKSGEETGSTVLISLRGANKAFLKEFLDNVDPRVGGLEKNIADFSSQGFLYSMPITEEHMSGIDVAGSGDVQYVQGLRVELAKESFGYEKPWFSYNFLDSSIIGGRDRNEIKEEITDRIMSFWHHVDSPDMLAELVRTAVYDSNRVADNIYPNSELLVLREILTADDTSEFFLNGIQKIVDDALLRELAPKKHAYTLVISSRERKNKNFIDGIEYAKEQGYEIRTTAADVGILEFEDFAKRLPDEYKIVTSMYIRNEMRRNKPKEEKKDVVEGEREKTIRNVFVHAAASVNELVSAVGMKPKTFELKFDIPQKVNIGREQDRYGDNDYGEEGSYGLSSRISSNTDLSPIMVGTGANVDCIAYINPNRILNFQYGDPRALQRKIEIYLLGGFTADKSYGWRREDILKESQKLLDTLITKLIPNDAPVLKIIPGQLEYEKDSAMMLRLTEFILGEIATKHQEEKVIYEMYRKAIDTQLTSHEAQEIHKSLQDSGLDDVKGILESRVFLNEGTFTYYNSVRRLWEQQDLTKSDPFTTWQGLPIYALNDGRYFIPASMQKGAVLAKGEGKNREYTFSEGSNFLHIGLHEVAFGTYGNRYDEYVTPHPAGFILPITGRRLQGSGFALQKSLIQKQLDEYHYYPIGSVKREGSIEKRIFSTAIPIEYGQDEWDNPIRVFQDVIQNHIDASREGQEVQLIYEIDRDGNRALAGESDLLSSDKITGFTIQDKGPGYYPNDIAIMGASSKKSPLFAGKYGEGQKMIAAAALRNGFELTYKSTVQSSVGMESWKAQAVSEARLVVLDGKEVEKKLIAFDVVPITHKTELGSATTLRLPLQAPPDREKQWKEWVSIIDPRQKDARGNGGLARYVRQLRQSGLERVYTVGSISVLLDEPGAVYENGLRINPQAEKGRSLSFGYDVPEIVTTRERNSYDADRLRYYMTHAISNISDPSIVEEILRKVANSGAQTPDLDIGVIMAWGKNATSIWAEVAQKVWPDYVVYSSERIDDEIQGSSGFSFMGIGERDEVERKAQRERAKHIKANMVHIDKSKVLDVPKRSYPGFSRLLATAESVIEKIETEVLPVPPIIKRVLSELVAESTKVFINMLQKARGTLTDEQFRDFSFSESRLGEWDNAAAIESRNAVAIAPISSGFHGKADKGIIFNEVLLLDLKENRRKLAEVSLHETAHIVSGYDDYQENFVTLLYELAHYLAKA